MTQTPAVEQAEEQEDAQRDKYLTFHIENEQYGLDIRYVTEIVGIQSITAMPEQPEYIRGIINLRGRIIPVMDVRLRFRKPSKDYDDRTCIVVVSLSGTDFGLIVDSVAEVLSIPREDIVKSPVESGSPENAYIQGIAKVGTEVKLLLDCRKLLMKDDLESIMKEAAKA